MHVPPLPRPCLHPAGPAPVSSGPGDKKCTCRFSKCIKLYCVCWAGGEDAEGEAGGVVREQWRGSGR